MKKRLFIYVLSLALLVSVIFGTGCTCKACQYEATKNCNYCVANCLESSGDCLDCTDIVRNLLMGEGCHDHCVVRRNYAFANMCRDFGNGCVCESCSDGRSWSDVFIEGIPHLGNIATWRCEQTRIEIPNLNDYYKMTFTFYFTPEITVQDFCIFFNVAEEGEWIDTDYYSLQGRFLYVAPLVLAGQTVSASTTFFFSYDSIEERYGINYDVRITDFLGKELFETE